MTKRKGFTLIELLIVVVIIGVLSSMMSIASVESTDAAKATAIIGNLSTIKKATLAVYVGDPAIASKTSTNVSDVIEAAAKYMGTTKEALGTAHYGITIVDSDTDTNVTGGWYVTYDSEATANISTAVQKIIADRAQLAGLYGLDGVPAADLTNSNIYQATNATYPRYIVMQIR